MRAYNWKPSFDSDSCVVIIADNIKEAKKLGLDFWKGEYGFDNEYTDIVVKWQKNANIDGLPKGEISLIEGLKRELYGYVYADCDKCGKDAMLEWDKKTEKCLCDECMYPEEVKE